MQLSDTTAGGGSGAGPPSGSDQEPCRFPKLEECAHFHYERVQLPALSVTIQTNMDKSLHSQHTLSSLDGSTTDPNDYYTLQVTCREECWLIQRSLENFSMLDYQLHQCIYDRKVSQLPDLSIILLQRNQSRENDAESDDDRSYSDLETVLSDYLERLCSIIDNSLNCGPILNWFQLDNRGHRLLVPSEESRSINTPAVAAAYSVRKYVSQARDELSLEVGDMISVIDMASPGESVWWRGKRGFQVGFFPQHCVHIIGDKVPRNMPLPPPVVGSLALSPIKPVLRKHGKLITFFRSFILNRPSRRRLKQSGILKERVFGCDLGEHLLNSGHDIPMVLKCCAEFIESHGIVDGIYRLSGVTSNIQKLRNAFDEDRIPNLYTDDILQDIHSVASLLKMYFRELPNPLCTYQLYHSFVSAVQGCTASRSKSSDNERLLKMREAVQKLPPPHYRTLEYLVRHLARVATHGANTGMTTRNVAIVWAPNLLRCEELEVGGVAALQGVGVQAVVTEFLVCYADLIFSDHLPNLNDQGVEAQMQVSPKRSRPKSLAISTPTKLLTLEEARNKHLLSKNDDCNYIEVGGGPKTLPKMYHTVIDLPAGSRKRGLSKRSPSGWRSFFSKSRNSSHGNLSKNRDISSPGVIPIDKSVTESDLNEIKRKLRPVKSAESLTSGQSEPATCEGDVLGPLYCLSKPSGHNRSVSHDSYFDNLQSSTNNSVGSLLDLSEIQLNFELEESEMRIFSEDESLVSSPKVHKEGATRKGLSRARPEDFSSATNSSNPSPKKQPRVLLSPDSLSRKRSRLEDQLSDIQYIDCNTPDNPCVFSTTALIHNEEQSTTDTTSSQFEGYQPKNKSPRNSNASNRYSLNFEKIDKVKIPKSRTEMDFQTQNFNLNLTPTPQTPNYKPLDGTSTTNTPILTPESYQNLNYYSENSDIQPPPSPTYENVLTTISITYKSPTKSRNSDNIYEDIELNPEQAVVPTTIASLPIQEASQPTLDQFAPLTASLETNFDESFCSGESSTLKELSEHSRPTDLNLLVQSFDSVTNLTATYKSMDDLSSNSITPSKDNISKKSLISPTEDISTSEQHSSATTTPQDSSSSSRSRSPIISPINVSNCTSQLSQLDLSEAEESTSNSSNCLKQTSLSSDDLSNLNNKSDKTDKRKSCDAELLDENTIYQQVKYFRRSIHEINTLLDLPLDESKTVLTKSKSVNNCLDSLKELDLKIPDHFDSLEPEKVHLYENVEQRINSNKDLDEPRNRMHENVPKKLEITPDIVNEIPVCSKCSDPSDSTNIDAVKKTNVKNLTSKFENTNSDILDNSSNKKIVSKDSSNDLKSSDSFKSDLKINSNSSELKSPKTCSNNDLKSFESKSDSKVSLNYGDSKSNTKNGSKDDLKFVETKFDSKTSSKNDLKYLEVKNSSKDNLNCGETKVDRKNSSNNDLKYLDTKQDSKDSLNSGESKFNPKTSSNNDLDNKFEVKNDYLNKFDPKTSLKNDLKSLDTKNESKSDYRSSSNNDLKSLDNKNHVESKSKLKTSSNSDLKSEQLKELKENSATTHQKSPKVYDKDSLPPCLRAKNAKNSIKTRSLDENAFVTEFGRANQSLQRRKSLDDRTSSYIDSKLLVEPAKVSSCSTSDIRIETQKPKIELCTEQKLNRERIEKYKEERRTFLREKYRSESFKEDKDKLLSRLKQQKSIKLSKSDSLNNEVITKITPKSNLLNSDPPICESTKKPDPLKSFSDCSSTKKLPLEAFSKFETTPKLNARKNSPLFDRKTRPSLKELSDKILDEDQDEIVSLRGSKEDEFLRHRRGDADAERRRHTYDLLREREIDAESNRRVSLESKNPRKEKCSPSYCIKDMKAIFESKSHQ